MRTYLMRFFLPSKEVSTKQIMSAVFDACDKAGCHVRDKIQHEFHPQGMTSCIILAESHIAISTWPEDNLAYVDYFSCADDPKADEFWQSMGENGFELIDLKEILR